jgi:excisionase family DNA binding protein
MTHQEAANYLRISLATIDQMVRAGEISSVLIRRRRLFRIRDLDDYIHSHCIPGTKCRPWTQRLRLLPRNDPAGRVDCLDLT